MLRTTEPPNATITDATDERIRAVDPVQEGLQQAANARDSVAEIEVTEAEYETVAQALSERPWYDRSEYGSRQPSGVYFRYENEAYVVTLTPFCADSPLVDAGSERGEYGWGGCYDREEWGYA
ncbi:hypothetical protein [Halopiger xanaduensis]|uniref:hypothetical protein n=1 Tax=Halopiger xanaduensis TaxID=387343 RepID=UPI000677E754|nr:hypothetical protein [Halopiger xanaduensis]